MLTMEAQSMLYTYSQCAVIFTVLVFIGVLLKLYKTRKDWLLVSFMCGFMTYIVLMGGCGVYARTGAEYYARGIVSNKASYYTYGKYSGSFERAVIDFKADKSEARAYTLYDVEPGEEEWNEIRGGETAFYKFTVFVQHRVPDTDTSSALGSLSTPSFVNIDTSDKRVQKEK